VAGKGGRSRDARRSCSSPRKRSGWRWRASPPRSCEGCPPLVELLDRYAKAGGRYLVCTICFDAKKLDKDQLIDGADLGGTVPMWQWIGDDGATTFSY